MLKLYLELVWHWSLTNLGLLVVKIDIVFCEGRKQDDVFVVCG